MSEIIITWMYMFKSHKLPSKRDCIRCQFSLPAKIFKIDIEGVILMKLIRILP